jgi:hypothetical protein
MPMSNILLAKGDDVVPPDVTAAATEAAAALTNPFAELALATLILIPIIVVHGWSLGRVSKLFSSRFALYTPATPGWRVTVLTGTTIALLVFIHLAETVLWTIPLTSLGMIDNFRDAYYFVLEAYTTLGEGSISLPDQWRLMGPVIAITGLFTFGWTGSVLVYVMTQIGKLHAERSKDEATRA